MNGVTRDSLHSKPSRPTPYSTEGLITPAHETPWSVESYHDPRIRGCCPCPWLGFSLQFSRWQPVDDGI